MRQRSRTQILFDTLTETMKFLIFLQNFQHLISYLEISYKKKEAVSFQKYSLEKGKGLNFRALGFRPFPGLGQKNIKKMKNGCFAVVR